MSSNIYPCRAIFEIERLVGKSKIFHLNSGILEL